MPGKTEASLVLDSQTGDSATFTATFEGHKADNPYELWITMNGYDAEGVNRARNTQGLRWNEEKVVPVGTTCTATLQKGINPLDEIPDPVRWEAFVSDYPDIWTAVSDVVKFDQ